MIKKIEELLPLVENPARYLGREINVYIKKQGKVKIAIGYPDIYEVGMSSLGLRILYGILNERDDCICERFFLPWIDMENLMRERGIPLFTLETKTPLFLFDIIGVSLSSELNFTNFLNILSLSNIPIFSKDRKKDHPIIIVGGNSTFNPLPLAPFVDAFFIGEGEDVSLEIIDIVKEYRGNRFKILENLNKIESIFIPLFRKEKVKKAFVKDLNEAFFPVKYVVPLTQIIHDRISIEIMRGCGQRCKFCQSGSCWRPVRIRNWDKILEIAKETYKNTGYEEISLLSFSAGDHPQIEKIVKELVEEFKKKNVSISFPSLRIDTFSFQLALKIKEIKKTNLTFAPETSENLRKKIGKNIKDEDLIKLVIQAKENNYRHIKLYFMIGLPQETEKDLEDIVKLIKEISKIINVNISFNTFVPKPHTSFQSERFIKKEEYEDKRNYITEKLKKNKHLKFKFQPYETSFIECLLGRGDEDLSSLIYNVWKKGNKFENWKEFFRFKTWIETIEQERIFVDKYLGYLTPPFKWDFIEV
ncbi:MAG: radical SAM protein [Candidatus Omnitrophica bacterium]|nr:radical SAM protein [Candidatus Omnitrophota bacterium]MCM8802412.1 radical SAM protein [Candidatus Omnitrophota bacterium]